MLPLSLDSEKTMRDLTARVAANGFTLSTRSEQSARDLLLRIDANADPAIVSNLLVELKTVMDRAARGQEPSADSEMGRMTYPLERRP